MSKPQLHYSRLATFWGCPQQIEQYDTVGPVPPGVAAITGSATHLSININMTHKIDTGELISLEEAESIAHDYVAGEFKRGAYLLCREDREAKKPEAHRDEAIDWAVKLSGLHYRELAPTLQPTHVERKWCVEVPGLSHDLAGKLDLQQGFDMIDDYKTCVPGRKPTQFAAHISPQLTMYNLGQMTLDGTQCKGVRLVGLVKYVKPQPPVVFESTRTKEHFRELLDCIDVALRQMAAGLFPPCHPDSWRCCPKWCGWFPCKYRRGYRVFQGVEIGQ